MWGVLVKEVCYSRNMFFPELPTTSGQIDGRKAGRIKPEDRSEIEI
jgi:hypothetical protein